MLHIETTYNFADILSKHLGYQGRYSYELIQPVFHREGNTAALFLDHMLEVDVSISDVNTEFSILGSDRTLTQPLESMLMFGQTIVQEQLPSK